MSVQAPLHALEQGLHSQGSWRLTDSSKCRTMDTEGPFLEKCRALPCCQAE